ncbi:N(6)-adenine-specific DNA methyltransferase 2, partial [Stegodyphus mimosarum]
MLSDDNDIQLSEHTLKALQEFYKEQEEKSLSENTHNNSILVEEDWKFSQFWYDETTAKTLARIALKAAGENGKIACVSCPSAYAQIKELHPDSDGHYLFEYDKRFQERFPEHFVYYDYNYPLNIDKKFKSYFDTVIVDPPYLSEECLQKTSETVQYLTKEKIVLCTGAVMEDCAKKLLGVIATNFR